MLIGKYSGNIVVNDDLQVLILSGREPRDLLNKEEPVLAGGFAKQQIVRTDAEGSADIDNVCWAQGF